MATKRSMRVVRVGDPALSMAPLAAGPSAPERPSKKPYSATASAVLALATSSSDDNHSDSASASAAAAAAARASGPPCALNSIGNNGGDRVDGRRPESNAGCGPSDRKGGAEDASAVEELRARVAAQQSRIEELLAIRQTGPERALAEYRRLVEKELAARSTACGLYRAEAALRDKEIQILSTEAEEALAEERAQCQTERARCKTLEAEIDLLRSTSHVPAAPHEGGGRTGGPEGRPPSQDSARVVGAGLEPRAAAVAHRSSGPPDHALDRDPREPTSSELQATLNLLQALTGVVSMELQDKASQGRTQARAFLLTIENPLDNRRFRFKLSSDSDSQLSYEPVDFEILNAPSSAVLRECLDFDRKNAPALFRQLLAYVFEKKTEEVEPLPVQGPSTDYSSSR